MKASIIIPVYNGEDTIRETIESALAQAYDDFEVIVVNDGSTDRTLEIVKQFSQKITLINTPGNYGVAAARNAGASRASDLSADVILPLDADDLLDPSYLSETTLMMREGVAVVSTDMQYFGKLNMVVESKVSTPSYNGLPNTSLIRTKVFNAVGGYSPAIMYEDWDLWLKIIKSGQYGVSLLHKPLFLYRVGLNVRNTMQDQSREKYRNQIMGQHV